jgi:hypothetical protein
MYPQTHYVHHCHPPNPIKNLARSPEISLYIYITTHGCYGYETVKCVYLKKSINLFPSLMQKGDHGNTLSKKSVKNPRYCAWCSPVLVSWATWGQFYAANTMQTPIDIHFFQNLLVEI